MRSAGLILVLLAGCLQAQTLGIAGVVVDQGSGQALRGVHLRFITGDMGTHGGVEAVYGAESDAAGHFSVQGLKPGLYLVMVERAGYVQVFQGASPLNVLALKAGQSLTDFKVEMVERAVIAGHVMDEYGDPVQNVQVNIEPVDRSGPGAIGMAMGGGSASTDDRGSFRVVTAPGRYYVQARAFGSNGSPQEVRVDGSNGAPFVGTYYPSAVSTSGASAVQVGAGQDATGIDIRMARGAAAGERSQFTISGVVNGVPSDGHATVMLSYGDKNPDRMNSMMGTGTADGNKFTFRGRSPGFYSVSALYQNGKTVLVSRPVSFRLDGADQTNVQLTLMPAEEMAGTLEFVGGGAKAERRTVRLESAAGSNPMGQIEPAAGEVGADGAFRLKPVLPGRFRPVVSPLSENSYIKEVAVDGKAAPDGVVELSQGVGNSRLKITVSAGGAQIAGKVLGKDGEPLVGMASVVLLRDPMTEQPVDTSRPTDGTYSFKGLRPGKYRIAALDVLSLMSAISGGDQQDMMKFVFEVGEPFEVKEGDRVTRDVTAISKMPEKK